MQAPSSPGGVGGGGATGDGGGAGPGGGSTQTTVVTAPKVSPDRVRLRVARRLRRGTTTLVSTGRVVRPAGTTLAACYGKVQILVKANGLTLSLRNAKLRPDCTFRSQVTFRGLLRRLTVRAIFAGNDTMRRATSGLVRFGRR